jgi:thioredoxin reductase
MPPEAQIEFDVAIVGGGPAGLSAAVVLGRSRRRVVLFDNDLPRNFASQGVHCFLSRDGIRPSELREIGRGEAAAYGVELVDEEVTSASVLQADEERTAFSVETKSAKYVARTILLTTGVVDVLPEIRGFRELYGRSVHHCPYCDGWEHRDQHLVAFCVDKPPIGLATSLKTWSPQVTVCTNGCELDDAGRSHLKRHNIPCREEKVVRLQKDGDGHTEVVFESGPPLSCDAVFFNADRVQHSPLAKMLGCETDGDKEVVRTERKQGTCVEGVFVAGDADGDVQFAIVAAAEGAIAATAINTLLQKQDQLA